MIVSVFCFLYWDLINPGLKKKVMNASLVMSAICTVEHKSNCIVSHLQEWRTRVWDGGLEAWYHSMKYQLDCSCSGLQRAPKYILTTAMRKSISWTIKTELSSLSWLLGAVKDGGEPLYICTTVITATYLYKHNYKALFAAFSNSFSSPWSTEGDL